MDTSSGRGVSKLDTVSCEFLVNLAKKWKIPCDLSAAQGGVLRQTSYSS